MPYLNGMIMFLNSIFYFLRYFIDELYIYDDLYFNSLNIDFAVSVGIFDETKTFKHNKIYQEFKAQNFQKPFQVHNIHG